MPRVVPRHRGSLVCLLAWLSHRVVPRHRGSLACLLLLTWLGCRAGLDLAARVRVAALDWARPLPEALRRAKGETKSRSAHMPPAVPSPAVLLQYCRRAMPAMLGHCAGACVCHCAAVRADTRRRASHSAPRNTQGVGAWCWRQTACFGRRSSSHWRTHCVRCWNKLALRMRTRMRMATPRARTWIQARPSRC